MRRVIPLALAGACVLFGMQIQSTRGQTAATSTPTPSPTSTATPPPPPQPTPTPHTKPTPSAAQLLARAQAAVVAKNTTHQVSRTTISTPGKGSLTITTVADQSLRPMALHEVATESGGNIPGLTSSSNANLGPIDLIVAKGQIAERIGKTSWTCHSLGNLPATSAMSSLPPAQFSALFKHLTVAGTKTVDGVLSWHVHGELNLSKLGIPASAGKVSPAPLDVYISQADYTIVREALSLSISSKGVVIQEKVRTDFSRYGELVDIHLPAKCTLPVLFSIQTIKIDRNNAKPNWSLKRPSRKRVLAGQKVQLSLYVYLHRVRRVTHTYEVERVYRQGRLVFHERTNDVVKPKDAHSQAWYADTFTPWHPGHFRVTATYVAGKLHKQKTVWFWVVKR